MNTTKMLDDLRHILAMIRFSHTVFALPFALLAAVMAWCTPAPESVTVEARSGWLDFLGIVICMVCARSAAMAFNRLADHQLDADNPRTAGRHLPAGILTPSSVWLFTAITSAAFVAGTLLFLPNVLPLALSVPVLMFLGMYSFTKRYTAAAHFWLGASLMLAPISTWIALRGQFLLQHPLDILPAIWLGGAVLWWVAGFDIIYACQDADHDASARLHSIPAALGIQPALRLAAVSHFLMIGFLFTLPSVLSWSGANLELGRIYWSGVIAVAALLVYEHWLVRPDDLTRVNVAFFQVNAIVSIGLFLVASLDLLL